jgi:hypothetical protein
LGSPVWIVDFLCLGRYNFENGVSRMEIKIRKIEVCSWYYHNKDTDLQVKKTKIFDNINFHKIKSEYLPYIVPTLREKGDHNLFKDEPKNTRLAAVAQLGERQTEDLEVAGSSPARGMRIVSYLVISLFFS